MTPETMKLGDEALPVGKKFEDSLPGGPKFTVLSVDATQAVIQVELQGQAAEANKAGKGTCSDGSELQPETMVKCVAPPTPAAPPADGGAPADGGGGPGDAAPGGLPGADAGTPPGKPIRTDAAAGEEPPEEPGDPLAPRSAGGCQVAGGGSGLWLLLLVVVAVRRGRRRDSCKESHRESC